MEGYGGGQEAVAFYNSCGFNLCMAMAHAGTTDIPK